MRRSSKAGLAATAGLGGLLVGVSVLHLTGKPGDGTSRDLRAKDPDSKASPEVFGGRRIGSLPVPVFHERHDPVVGPGPLQQSTSAARLPLLAGTSDDVAGSDGLGPSSWHKAELRPDLTMTPRQPPLRQPRGAAAQELGAGQGDPVEAVFEGMPGQQREPGLASVVARGGDLGQSDAIVPDRTGDAGRLGEGEGARAGTACAERSGSDRPESDRPESDRPKSDRFTQVPCAQDAACGGLPVQRAACGERVAAGRAGAPEQPDPEQPDMAGSPDDAQVRREPGRAPRAETGLSVQAQPARSGVDVEAGDQSDAQESGREDGARAGGIMIRPQLDKDRSARADAPVPSDKVEDWRFSGPATVPAGPDKAPDKGQGNASAATGTAPLAVPAQTPGARLEDGLASPTTAKRRTLPLPAFGLATAAEGGDTVANPNPNPNSDSTQPRALTNPGSGSAASGAAGVMGDAHVLGGGGGPVKDAARGARSTSQGLAAPVRAGIRAEAGIRIGTEVEAREQGPISVGTALPAPAFGLAGVRPGLTGERQPMEQAAKLVERQDGQPGFAQSLLFTPDDELILEFRTAGGEVTDTITAYGTRAAVYLPLGEIARLLDLALVVSDDGRYVSGWVLDENDTVTLNLRAHTKAVAGTETALDPREAQSHDGELYVRSDVFSVLMPLDIKVDLRAQTVTVRTRRPFPFEQRSIREAAREKLSGRNPARSANAYPREVTPYRALDLPVGEAEVRGVSDEARGTRLEADVRLAGDFAYMTAQAYVSATTRDGPTSARLTLGRRDPDSDLLGPIRASVFELGDVSTEALGIGLRGIAGRGAMVSNAPVERASIFDRIDLRGELPDGYEAELYRNNTLVGSTRTPVNGRYEFLQIPVEFGLNVLRIVLYGPQGQRRETVRQVSVGDGRLAAGDWLYSLSAAQKDVNLLGLRGPDFVPSLDHGRWRASGQVAYGVNAAVTGTLGGAWYDSDKGQHWLATTGLRTSIRSIAGQINLGLNDRHGVAIETRLAGTLQGLSWSLIHAQYEGQFSDEVRALSAEPLARASEADLTGTLRLGKAEAMLAIPFAAKVRRIEFADHKVQLDASLRASAVLSRLLVSNTLSLSRQQSPQTQGTTQVLGAFDLGSLSGGRTRYRAGVGYSLMPRARLNRLGVEVDRQFGPATAIKLSAGRAFDTRETLLGTSAIHRMGPLSLALDGTLTLPRKEHAVILRLGFSFGRNPVSQSWFMAQPGMTAGGAVAVTAFLDENGNRQRDDGEALIEGAEFDTGVQAVRTRANGTALIGQLGNGNRTFLRLNAESLPDIAMAPVRPGIELVPRPGRIHVAAFAIEMLGDIEGTAMFGAERQGVSGLVLLLIDAGGKQVARARTSAGGAFLFEQVRPGTYQVVLEPGQARRLALEATALSAIYLDGKTPVVRVMLPVHKLGGQ